MTHSITKQGERIVKMTSINFSNINQLKVINTGIGNFQEIMLFMLSCGLSDFLPENSELPDETCLTLYARLHV